MIFIDLAGKRFGRLVPISSTPKIINGHSRRFWLCSCDCGASVESISTNLMSGNTRSCGCLKTDLLSTHRKSSTPEYRVWAGMVQRCTNPRSDRYGDYGGRGITVCEQWLSSFETFLSDMGIRPGPDYSIDRINNESSYSKSNCKWSTRSEQQKNKRQYDSSNLPHGDDHWTRRDRSRARLIAQRNIQGAHHSGEKNPNSKLNPQAADAMREVHRATPGITMNDLGMQFGVGRETARKVIRRILW